MRPLAIQVRAEGREVAALSAINFEARLFEPFPQTGQPVAGGSA
jgi:hypothetical protein